MGNKSEKIKLKVLEILIHRDASRNEICKCIGKESESSTNNAIRELASTGFIKKVACEKNKRYCEYCERYIRIKEKLEKKGPGRPKVRKYTRPDAKCLTLTMKGKVLKELFETYPELIEAAKNSERILSWIQSKFKKLSQMDFSDFYGLLEYKSKKEFLSPENLQKTIERLRMRRIEDFDIRESEEIYRKGPVNFIDLVRMSDVFFKRILFLSFSRWPEAELRKMFFMSGMNLFFRDIKLNTDNKILRFALYWLLSISLSQELSESDKARDNINYPIALGLSVRALTEWTQYQAYVRLLRNMQRTMEDEELNQKIHQFMLAEFKNVEDIKKANEFFIEEIAPHLKFVELDF